jgi:hypothetical protein
MLAAIPGISTSTPIRRPSSAVDSTMTSRPMTASTLYWRD